MRHLVLLAAIAIPAMSICRAQPNFSADPNLLLEIPTVKAARITCTGMIDDGLYKSIIRRSNEAIEEGATYLIYEISTYGGLLKSADDISKYFIHDLTDKAHTVAYVKTEAISAGALISVSCKDIIMNKNTTIGDCAPITMGGKLEGVEREKAESFTRAAFDRAAQANSYPQALLRAMVSMQLEVWAVKNLQSGKTEYFEKEKLPTDANSWDLTNKTLVVKDDQILTMTANQAKELGIARAVVDDIDGLLVFFQTRDNVKFSSDIKVYYTNWSEQIVRFINSPAVMGILVLVAMLGVYVELNTPGLGLPGLIAAVAFAVIIGSKFIIGLANWFEVAVFILGIILLLIEFFVLPGFGIAGIAGIICIIFGLIGMLVKNAPDELPWPTTDMDWRIFAEGALGLLVGMSLFIIAAAIITRYLPKFSAFAGLSLAPASAKTGKENEISMTTSPDQALTVAVGDVGQVVTPLRPAGRANFGPAMVDVVCRGEFLDKGTSVEIMEICGNRVVVRAKEA